jgi:lipopolysaccharide/colanic/teichoic acid biosynthesis glycosyltransferase
MTIGLAEVRRPGKRWERVIKRTIDLVASLLLIVLLLPVMVVISLTVFLSTPGGILFRQQRMGRRGRPFAIFKFRSMSADAEQRLECDPQLREAYLSAGYKVPMATDPRITSVGRILRATSLDELPQLFNVLCGHMSLVGPRPVRPFEISEYDRFGPLVLSVRPGMTGLWQVNGRSETSYSDRVAFDVRYVTQWKLLLDMKILFRTIPAVLFRRGTDCVTTKSGVGQVDEVDTATA